MLASQTAALAFWPDGSVKWLLVEFMAPAGVLQFELRQGEAGSASSARSTELASADGDSVRLTWGDLELQFGSPRVQVMRGPLAVGTISLDVLDAAGQQRVVRLARASLEKNGPHRATVVLDGTAELADGVMLTRMRISACARDPLLRIDVTIHNPGAASHPGNLWELGDAGSVRLKEIAVRLDLPGRGDSLGWANGPGGWHRAGNAVLAYQESSGGANWRGPVHLAAGGAVPMRTAAGLVAADDRQIECRRLEPAVEIVCGQDSWAAGLLNFWQEFPSGLAASPHQLTVKLLPAEFPVTHELQGGERKTRSVVLAHGPVAVARTAVEQALRPSVLVCDPAEARRSDAILFLSSPADSRHDAIVGSAVQGEESFLAKRERADEYGWRNFGDLVADHESAFSSAPLVSHYNNQYDAVAGFIFQFVRTGDTAWWLLADSLARHVVDVDIYHTRNDKAAYNGGQFWHTYHYVDAGLSTHRSYPKAPHVHGGGPSAEQNYNAGLALHYYLTGWNPSRDAAVGLAQWVIDMDDGGRTPFRWLATGDTGLASASGNPLYHGPGRGGGNSINALIVGFELTEDRRFLAKAEQLIRRCISPEDDLEALKLLDAERRWYYTVFLDALGRYLWLKQEIGELDGMYGYGRRALLHYAVWMRGHEYPYLEKPDILEFPTETWSAQDIRKSDVLAWAALCSTGEERARFLGASRRFFEDVMTRLPALATWRLTRPVVLLLWRGYGLAWTEAHPEALLEESAAVPPRPNRSFEPQKIVAIRRAKAVAATFALIIIALLIALIVR